MEYDYRTPHRATLADSSSKSEMGKTFLNMHPEVLHDHWYKQDKYLEQGYIKDNKIHDLINCLDLK